MPAASPDASSGTLAGRSTVEAELGRPVLWLIGGPAALARVERQLAVSTHVVVREAGLSTVLREAQPTDLVLLTGRLPVEVVEDTEALLKRGLTIALEIGDRDALRRALSRRRLGLDLVALSARPLSLVERLAFR